MLNINRGHNQELMERCRRLWEYSEFIAEVNDYLDKGYHLQRAITAAMNNCIERGVLTDILLVNKAEVMGMLLTEYNEKKHMKAIRREGYEDGREQGRAEGRCTLLEEQIRKKLARGKSVEIIAQEVEEDLDTVKAILLKIGE